MKRDQQQCRFRYGAREAIDSNSHASADLLRTIANRYNRFPHSDAEHNQSQLVVATRIVDDGYWGSEAVDRVSAMSEVSEQAVVTLNGEYLIAPCLVDAIDSRAQR